MLICWTQDEIQRGEVGKDWLSLDMATDLTADVCLYWDQEKIIPFFREVCVEVYVVSGIRVQSPKGEGLISSYLIISLERDPKLPDTGVQLHHDALTSGAAVVINNS